MILSASRLLAGAASLPCLVLAVTVRSILGAFALRRAALTQLLACRRRFGLVLVMTPLVFVGIEIADGLRASAHDRFANSSAKPSVKLAEKAASDFAFLQGLWVGQTEDGAYAEEYWSAPKGDSLLGHGRFVKDGQATFLEFMQIVKTSEGWVLRMRHFSGEMKPWSEEKESGDCFVTAFVSNKEVVFDNKKSLESVRVTYRKRPAHRLFVLVEVNKNGKKQEYPFEYKRIAN